MKRISFYIFLFTVISCGCDDYFGKVDKSLISDIEKLVSPNGEFILYRYYIESSMASGSGFTVMQVLNAKDICDYTKREFFRLDNDYPFFIKWKTEDTLTIKCLINGGELSDIQPIKKEIKKWKGRTFEVEYYSMYSATAELKHSIDNYIIDEHFIKFKSKEDSFIFRKDEIQISLDTTNIYLMQFKIDSFNSKLGLSFSHYDFKNKFNKNDFLELQAFIRIKP